MNCALRLVHDSVHTFSLQADCMLTHEKTCLSGVRILVLPMTHTCHVTFDLGGLSLGKACCLLVVN